MHAYAAPRLGIPMALRIKLSHKEDPCKSQRAALPMNVQRQRDRETERQENNHKTLQTIITCMSALALTNLMTS